MSRNQIITRSTLLLATAILLGLSACSKEQAATVPENSRAVAVRTTAVEQRSVLEEVAVTGTIKPQAQVQVVSEISARMLRLNKDEGAWVNKGEIIAVLDPTDARLAADRANAAVAVAEANRAHATTERDRANNLIRTGGITDKDHLSATVSLQVAEASLLQVKAEAAIAAQQLARCQIKAPFSGRVAKRLVDAGTMLAPGTPVVQLVDNSVLEFRASVPSADLPRVKIGAPVVISVDALPGSVLHGQVTRILPLVDERSRSFEVVSRVSESNNLVSGLFGRGRIKVREIKDALVLPPSSIMHDGQTAGRANVFVIEQGKAQLRQVELGVEGADSVEIRSGITPGTLVVIDPPTTLAAGAPVQIQNTGKTADSVR
jgi:membrane fusion protein (multidrug efflux system)